MPTPNPPSRHLETRVPNCWVPWRCLAVLKSSNAVGWSASCAATPGRSCGICGVGCEDGHHRTHTASSRHMCESYRLSCAILAHDKSQRLVELNDILVVGAEAADSFNQKLQAQRFHCFQSYGPRHYNNTQWQSTDKQAPTPAGQGALPYQPCTSQAGAGAADTLGSSNLNSPSAYSRLRSLVPAIVAALMCAGTSSCRHDPTENS